MKRYLEGRIAQPREGCTDPDLTGVELVEIVLVSNNGNGAWVYVKVQQADRSSSFKPGETLEVLLTNLRLHDRWFPVEHQVVANLRPLER